MHGTMVVGNAQGSSGAKMAEEGLCSRFLAHVTAQRSAGSLAGSAPLGSFSGVDWVAFLVGSYKCSSRHSF